ncbi:MAG TPA: hypothetical protein VFQ53_07005 [Kofleriaceae bacterium]|nr:hypothetical protein [Kofleriaceae bacterium]
MRLLIVGMVLVLAQGLAAAQPCVTRSKHGGDSVRDGKLVDGKLVFCTWGTKDICWSMDPATRAFTPIATFPKPETKYSEEVDPTGRAKATQTGVEFCPTKDRCQSYKYKFKFRGTLWVAINDEGTLGAVTYEGDSMKHEPTWVMLYDLVKKKQIKRVDGARPDVFATTFLVYDTFYTAAGKKLGTLPEKLVTRWDAGPVRIPRSNLMAAANKFRAQLTIVDTATAKITQTIDLPLKTEEGTSVDAYQLVPSADGAQLHVVASAPFPGEVITIDPATGKQLARSAPPLCK